MAFLSACGIAFGRKSKDQDEECHKPCLPLDIMAEILSRMPVLDLVRWRCVCKQWNDLIQYRHFIQKHVAARNSSCTFYRNIVKVAGNVDEEDDPNNGKSKKETFQLISGCDGMLLERSNFTRKYVIQNPMTRKILYLPDPASDFNPSITFSFVPSTGEYKLVSVYRNPNTGYEGCEILNVGDEDSWRPLQLPISHGRSPSTRKLSVAAAGTGVHLFRETTKQLVSLDLTTECFTSTTLDQDLFSDWCKVWVLNWNGCPALVELGAHDVKVLIIEAYKERHKLARNMVTVPLRGPKEGIEGDAVLPVLADQGIFWLWMDSTLYGYNIINGQVSEQLSSTSVYKVQSELYIYKASLASVKGMQRLPSS